MSSPLEAYSVHSLRVGLLIALIQAELTRWDAETRHPDNAGRLWGYVGSMGHIEEQLTCVLAHLLGVDPLELDARQKREGQPHE